MRVKGYALVHQSAIAALTANMTATDGDDSVGGFVRIGEWGEWVAIIMMTTAEHIAALTPMIGDAALAIDVVTNDADAMPKMLTTIDAEVLVKLNTWRTANGLEALPSTLRLLDAVVATMRMFDATFSPYSYDIGGLPSEGDE